MQFFVYFFGMVIQIAAETQDLVYRGMPVVEDARSADTWNYGPLGGFINLDPGLRYHLNDTFTISGQVTSLSMRNSGIYSTPRHRKTVLNRT